MTVEKEFPDHRHGRSFGSRLRGRIRVPHPDSRPICAGSSNLGVLTVAQIAAGCALGFATFWWVEPVQIHWTSGLWVALAVTSLLATALAFTVQTWAQRYSSPTRTALIFAMEPVFAWMTSYVVAGEVLSRRAAIGGVLILAGILMVELKPFRLGMRCRNRSARTVRAVFTLV